MKSYSTTKQLTVNGKEQEVTFDFEISMCKECYGSDADGRRGVQTYSIDDWSFEALDEDFNTLEFTTELNEEAALIIINLDLEEVM